MTPEDWRDLREWLSRPLERVDPNRLVKFGPYTESILRAMDRLERGESVYENICGMCDEVLHTVSATQRPKETIEVSRVHAPYVPTNEQKEDIRFLLKLVPGWAKDSEPGLDPTMYGTLTYEGDLKVIERVESIRERVK